MKKFLEICAWWLANADGLSKEELSIVIGNDILVLAVDDSIRQEEEISTISPWPWFTEVDEDALPF